MSRFDDSYGDDSIPWDMWEQTVSRALAGRRGQAVLARLEEALLALPAPRLICGALASPDGVCAVGALVAYTRAQSAEQDMAAALQEMIDAARCFCGHGPGSHAGGTGACSAVKPAIKHPHDPKFHVAERPCSCSAYDATGTEDAWETADKAQQVMPMPYSVAWHLAWLNDEEFRGMTPEARYDAVLAFARRAQGKSTDTVAA